MRMTEQEFKSLIEMLEENNHDIAVKKIMIQIEQNTDKFPIDLYLVNRLIASQFPAWAHLPLKPVEHSGWDNRTFHLGDTMTVRLPSAAIYVNQVAMEHRWLPTLAPQLHCQFLFP